MPAKKKTKAPPQFETSAWDNEFLSNQRPLSLRDLDGLFDTWFHVRDPKNEKSQFAEYWDPECNASMCLCLIGDAGCGKSTKIKRWAARNEFDLNRIPTGDSMEEDSMPVFKQEYDEQGRHQYTFAPWMPMDKPQSASGKGLCFVDEIGTGQGGHQNMLATHPDSG